jgi:hypothetical protein
MDVLIQSYHTTADNQQTDAANEVKYAIQNCIVNTMQAQTSVDESNGGA